MPATSPRQGKAATTFGYATIVGASASGSPHSSPPKPLLNGKVGPGRLVVRWHWHRRRGPLELLARKDAARVVGQLLDEARRVGRQGAARIPEHATPGPQRFPVLEHRHDADTLRAETRCR